LKINITKAGIYIDNPTEQMENIKILIPIAIRKIPNLALQTKILLDISLKCSNLEC
jgi:hypothetical protein